MELHLSLYEVITKCTQALRALDFPPGLDIENGKNIGWLTSHGLPGIQTLFEEIKCAPTNTSPNLYKIDIKKDTVHFSNLSCSAFHLAQSAIDFAEMDKTVCIDQCRFPLLIFAEMARRKHLPFGFQIQLIKDDEITRGFSIFGESEITLNSRKLTAAYDLKITTAKDLILKNPLKMLSQEKGSKKYGISCNPNHWKAICATAKRVLVPDSEQSHSSAGAEVDDSI
tara:strand:- start:50 stop:727 length:678 start_codon:yes stop_codon:yes gene_type:complete